MSVNTVISEATASDRAILANLLQLYTHDFTDFEEWDIGDDGRFFDEPVDRWLTDPLRQPYFVRVDDKLAGFALVDRGSRINGDPDVVDMGEFFIMRRYRRLGVGTDVARWLFDHYPATWEVRQLPRNVQAQSFWRRVIGDYAGGRYEEFVAEDGDVVQRFRSAG